MKGYIMRNPIRAERAAAAACAALLSTSAAAQTGLEEAEETGIPSDWSLSGNVALYSDYRFRGISFSDEEAALQGGLDVAHASGFYAGVWGSNLAGFGSFGGANLEVDLYAGYGGDFAAIGVYDVGVLYYMYPGTDGTDYVELYGSVGADIAGAETTAGIAWAPDQDNLDDNLYLYADVGFGIPATPFAVTAHVGYTEGSLGLGGLGPGDEVIEDNYVDYSLGVAAEYFGLEFSLAYVDTDISKSRENLVGTRGIGVGDPFIADSQIVGSVGYSF